MNTKKYLAGFLTAAVVGTALIPVFSSALTAQDIQVQIQSLMSQIANLTSQLNVLQGQTSTSVSGGGTSSSNSGYRVCSILNRNLSRGISGDDVAGVQEFLQGQGYFSGNVSGYFGPLTANALAQWQVSQGISGVGAIGPVTRARILMWCGNPNPNPAPTCKPITYMPIACSDGTAAQPTHDSNGCITGYTCPIANFVPAPNCSAWFDGCNSCSRTSPNAPAACTLRACFAAGKGYCTATFDNGTGLQVPTISNFSGPTTLTVSQSGTWSISASDPQNGNLNYSVTWGDENQVPNMSGAMMASTPITQNTTFTHAYAAAGTYTVTIRVTDQSGLSAQTSSTVVVTGNGTVSAAFTGTPTYGTAPLTVAFAYSEASNSNQNFSINFGDGTSANISPVYYPCAFGAGSPCTDAHYNVSHTYTSAGTYSASLTASPNCSNGMMCPMYLRLVGTVSIQVAGNQTVCTALYDPVCGQPPEPACRHSVPACMIATPGPQTYSNRCEMNAAGASFLYSGQCQTYTACTADAMQCPNGSYVGRTGPNCQFVCPN